MKCYFCKTNLKKKDRNRARMKIEHDGILNLPRTGIKVSMHESCAKAYTLAFKVMSSAGIL